MEKLKVNLKYCYGIKDFSHEFDFSKRHANIIYAPNGCMKSSFAKVFKDLSISPPRKPKDIVKPSNPSECIVEDEKGESIPPENIFVIESEPKTYDSIKRQEALLVNIELEAEYNEILNALKSKKKEFLDAVAEYSQSPRKIEKLFTETFNKPISKFYECLLEIKSSIEKPMSVDYSNIAYEDIFNADVTKFLNKSGTIEKLANYIEQYDRLTESSPYFERGAFDHSNASAVCTNLNSNGFFKARHKVLLNSGEEISESTKLEDIFDSEKERIFGDKDLNNKFAEFDKAISNQSLKSFRQIIHDRQEILTKLEDIPNLQKDFWKSYFVKNKTLLDTLLDLYDHTSSRLKEIEDEAKNQISDWEKVLDTFKERFDVPFNIEISNKTDAGLGRETPRRSFKHDDSEEEINESDLSNNVLSTGEKRALYILNIIFEIQSRKLDANTLIIIDDIADSFDYKNKYAIVEYLSDILAEENFKAIVLTHNFDFFRTLESRLDVDSHDSCYIAVKKTANIELNFANEYLNAAARWKKGIESYTGDTRNKLAIASIPLVRNLVEYTTGKDQKYIDLTKALHLKEDTPNITMGDIFIIFNQVWKTNLPENVTDKFLPTLYNIADECMNEEDFGLNLENKLILSIATRLKTENFLNKTIIHGNQPPKQLGKKVSRFKEQHKGDSRISTLDKVLIMTPENIHFNSFMYEPIIDMSDSHLKKLYTEVKTMDDKI